MGLGGDGLGGSQTAPDFTPDALAPCWPGATQPYPPIPRLLGQGKGRKALRTHCCSILCQRSGIWRAAGGEEREAGQCRGAARLLGPLPACRAPARQLGRFAKAQTAGQGFWGEGGVQKSFGMVLLA